jgi:hypothetical protein
MTTHVEQLAAQIRQLSPLERQQLLNLVPDFGGTNAKPLSNTKLEFNGKIFRFQLMSCCPTMRN